MALTYGFYNSVNGDRTYDAIQISSIFDGIISDGVYATIGDGLAVATNSGMTVKVKPGRAWFNHTWTFNDADYPLTIGTAEVVLDRIDAVVLEVDATSTARQNSLKVVAGTPASTPSRPTLINTETVHQYALAYVEVGHGVTSIEASKIKNNRGSVYTTCPFVTCLLETIDISTLVAEWRAQFTEWMTAQAGDFTTWSTTQRALFDAWFQNIQVELDENVAALLLEKCRLLKQVIYLTLPSTDWTASGDFYVQTITTDENGTTLVYDDDTDNPILVDGFNTASPTVAQIKAYNKAFGILGSGDHTINQNGSVTFKVFKQISSNLRIGLKGV